MCVYVIWLKYIYGIVKILNVIIMMLFIFLSKFIIYVYYFFFVYVKKNVFFDECFIFGDFIIKKNSWLFI